MKINHISGSTYDGDVSVCVNFSFESGTNLSSAIESVEMLVGMTASPPRSVSRDTKVGEILFPNAAPVSEPVADTGASTARTRRPRTAPPSTTPDPTPPAEPATVTDIGTRRRRAAAPEAEGPKVYSDVDLSKAASNTAARLVELGDDGTSIVKLVLKDFNVETTSDIPADKRQKFLDDLAEEVAMAEAEAAAKTA